TDTTAERGHGGGIAGRCRGRPIPAPVSTRPGQCVCGRRARGVSVPATGGAWHPGNQHAHRRRRMELTACSIGEAAELIAGGQLSPVELTRAYLERIERINPKLNCFITLTPEEAMRQARDAEREIAQGERRGALHGIPLAIKDLY